ncbi:alpha/beta hydrolase fold protein [Aspergillus clavatus NRRL 1]|uniref:Alpha/beta hydrolase fold protein n=1 Tax=Aspergillus clavatus (strain ATCC 1007 / CBS 513.65 / DSM 816 / NCTC 3887 / NRRL 1 / QM 1276 / 107) TaxID=344612 RepID=A1CP16_ASPCL|nr:alpha/beta hydrolase fold protein [Aspergillus clavatus NRRL 1]EAW07387.1 alpha/beta hydrolase fold protein [Aspergillus clavatus NRRL 1]
MIENPDKDEIAMEIPIPPLPKERRSLPHRLNCFLQLWLLKSLATLYFLCLRLVKPPQPGTQPTLTKRYACRPTLETRVFYPRSYHSAQRQLLPLYLNIHGGGFVLGDATIDDPFCSAWANRTGMLVVSLNYRKAPLHPFPTATWDVAEVAKSVLADDSLPIDHSRIAIGGFSAGGNLALSASQLPGLKGRINAAVIYYPIVDFSHPPNEKLDSRPYQGGPADTLEKTSWWLDWGYVSVGQNRRDPLLSPVYAGRDELPPWIYMIGAQWDMLRLETQQMIHGLAGLEERVGVEQEEDFEVGRYKWTLARGCPHGFTHASPGRKKGGNSRRKREEVAQRIYEEAHTWLKKSQVLS